MTFTEAAAEVLRLAGKPLHYKEITELAIEQNLLSHVGKSPEVTMGARLAALLKKDDKTIPLVRVKPGVFALREWSEKKGRRGKAAVEGAGVETESAEVNALELEADEAALAASGGGDADDDDDQPIVSGEDALRADLHASGADLFDDEEDDDQPILAMPGAAGGAGGAAGAEGALDASGRRRRRRRRRGRGGRPEGEFASAAPREGVAGQTFVATAEGDAGEQVRDPLAPPQRPQIRDRQQIMGGSMPMAAIGADNGLSDGEELAGKELADAAMVVFGGFDRNGGPIAIRSLVEALLRRGRLVGDPNAAATQLSASLRADNLRRQAYGQRPRFRFAQAQRIAPTEWALGPDVARLEQELIAAVDRYREATRRAFLRRVQELPGHAFTELALLALERVGLSGLKSVRRAGAASGEGHFAAVHKTGADEIRTAVVVRKDGRELGRERVSDLRGALHHYGPATAGWLITTGQVLSGAREEAAAPGAAPIALFDGMAFCKLLEDHEVAVLGTRIAVTVPDFEFLELLRG